MRLTMTLDCDGAAFDEPASEIARNLRTAASRIERGDLPPLTLRDTNGNTVGRVQVTP